jgi:hypothetical protein
VAVSENRRLDDHNVADDSLHRESAVVDLRTNMLNYHATPLVDRAIGHVVCLLNTF